MFVFFLLAVILIILFLRYRNSRKRLIHFVNKFNGPPSMPLVGNALSFSGDPIESFNKFMELLLEYGSPYRLWLFSIPYITITEPEDVQLILNKNLEKDDAYKFLADVLGDGLITADLPKWRRNRRIINPAFNVTTLAEYFLENLNEENEKLVKRLAKKSESNEEFDISADIDFSSFTSINKTAMGYMEDEEESYTKIREKHHTAVQLVGKRFYRPWLRPTFVFRAYTYTRGLSKIFDEVHDLPKKMVKRKRQNYNEKCFSSNFTDQNRTSKNFLDLLFKYANADDSFTDKELTDEVLTLVFAVRRPNLVHLATLNMGSETTATTISFTLLMLAMRQDLQEKVYQEIKEVNTDSNKPLTGAELNKLHFMEQCIKESLRRFNIIPLIMRRTEEDITLKSGQIIPAGARINLLLAGIHLNERHYPNPYNWNPDNFHPDAVQSRHPYTFVPFGGGPRICLGYKYAILAAKAQLAAILRTFKIFTRLTMDNMKPDLWIIMRNADGYPVRLKRRC